MNNNQYQNVNQYQNQVPFQNSQPSQPVGPNEPETQKSSSSKALIIILLVLVLALTGVILYMQFGKKEEPVVVDDSPVITLKGEKKITITEGDKYFEDGYTAKSYDGSDLTSKVEIKNNVDSSVPGTYEISYSVVDNNQKLTTIKRTVVVEDLTLKLQLLGETTTNILKGSKYVESGYEAYDSKDGNLDAKVNVTGSVDSNVLGVAKVTYTVTNSLNKTITKERIVNVVSKKGNFDIELSASPVNNKKSIITVTITGSNYSYTLLPDGTKVVTKTAFYEADSTGNYEFRIFDIYGNEYVKQIPIKLEMEQLTLSDKIVTELYGYISSLVGTHRNFYQTIKVTADNASKEALLEGAYLSLGKNEPTNEELQTQARKIYNVTNATVIPTKTSLNGEGTIVSYTDGKWTGEGSTISGHQNGKLIKAEKNGNYIYLYDNYKFIDYMNVVNNAAINSEFAKVYSGSDKKVLVGNVIYKVANCEFESGFHDEDQSTTVTANETLYRHTFKLNADGTYHWVSSEPENYVSLDDTTVQKLYNYVSNAYSNYRNFYQTTKVTKANATKEALLEGAYVSLGKTSVTNAELQAQAKKIYNITGTTVVPTTIKIANIKYENGMWNGTSATKHVNGILIEAIKDGNNLYLYDSYQFIDFNNVNSNVAINSELTKIYSGSDKKVLIGNVTCKVANCSFANLGTINANDNVTIESNQILYMHTFKMNANGEYYWVSTEQVK